MNFPISQQIFEIRHALVRALPALLVALTLLGYSPLPLIAAANSPEMAPQPRPSATVQLYAAGVQLAPMLPDLLGFTKPKSYLLLLQNSQELRATGGFITAAGRITIANGRVTDLKLVDSYSIANRKLTHPLAPDPLKRYMGIEVLYFRDANWSPDFPTSARMAASLYAQDAQATIDGVIGIDLRAVQLLVGALAPLQISSSEIPLTSENMTDQMVRIREEVTKATSEFSAERKDFMYEIAEAALVRVKSGDFNILRMLNGITSALNERALQIWLPDPAAEKLLAHYGWDGRLQPETGADYLALVDTNMGYNKVDAVIQRAITQKVTWPNGAASPAQATVTVTYHNSLHVADNVCSAKVQNYKSSSYSEMIERCYFDYVRLYVPGGSKLIAIEGVDADSISTKAGERGTQTFAGYFSMKPDENHTVTFTYTLPPHITPENYRLVVQRQAGSGPLLLSLSVDNHDFAGVLDTTMVTGSLSWPAQTPALAKVK